MLAQHALAAGDTARAGRFSIDAAAAALASNAPEEALRLVEQALPVVSSPADRRVLLTTRDDAFAVLRRTGERLDGLTELAALAEAMRDPAIELDVQLRRASALRMSHDEDAAAELARRVRVRAAERGDAATRAPGDARARPGAPAEPARRVVRGRRVEIDLDGAEEAYRRAIELAEQLGDDRSLAAALREIGMIDFARGRAWFAGEVLSGRAIELLAAFAAGRRASTTLILASPVGPLFVEATEVLERALGIFERLGDRTGVMSTVIAMAYAQYAPVMHLSTSARHLEEIRRVTSRLSELVTESERARLDLQMLFGVHVYSRAKVVPGPRRSRGARRPIGRRSSRATGSIEFLAAGGVALSLLELGDVAGAERWLGLAATAASMAPSRTRVRSSSRPGAAWSRAGARRRGGHAPAPRARGRDGDGERPGLRAVRGPGAPGDRGGADRRQRPAGGSAPRWRSARPGARRARRAFGGPGQGAAAAPAGARAVGRAGRRRAGHGRARARRHRGCGDGRRRGLPGPPGRAPRGRQPGDRHPGGPGRASPGRRPRRRGSFAASSSSTLSRIAQGTADEKIRVAWLTGPVGRELVELAGPMDATPAAAPTGAAARAAPSLDDARAPAAAAPDRGPDERRDRRRARPHRGGRGQRLARLFARLGTSSRAEATSLAFRGLAAVGSR